MKRAVITIAATVAGTAGVLAYNPTAQTAINAATGTTTSSGGQSTAPQSGTGSSGSTGSGSTGSGSTGSGSTGSAAAGDAVTGQAVGIPWGTVQVQVTFSGTKITDVQAVQMPNSDGHSMMIAQVAQQTLSQEVLQAQSANVDMVSGATFTSQAYLQSVQSALDSHKG